MYIDFKRLSEEMKHPLWHLYWAPIMKELAALKETAEHEYEALKEDVYDFFEGQLLHSGVVLGKEVGIWDDERTQVDTAVIHHTSNHEWISLERLSAIELARIYAPAYASPAEGDKAKMSGKPISSGHVYDGKQMFWTYHYLVRPDGSYVPLLRPSEVGWHAGLWSTNLRSIAIVLDGDYENEKPSEKMLLTVAKLVGNNSINKEKVLGHNEVRPDRVPQVLCPSRLFLSRDGVRGWKEDLLELVA